MQSCRAGCKPGSFTMRRGASALSLSHRNVVLQSGSAPFHRHKKSPSALQNSATPPSLLLDIGNGQDWELNGRLEVRHGCWYCAGVHGDQAGYLPTLAFQNSLQLSSPSAMQKHSAPSADTY